MNNIISLRHAHSAHVGWENQYGMKIHREAKPTVPMFLGAVCSRTRPACDFDAWDFFITFRFGSRVTETFYGERAVALWKEWKARQFSNAKTKHKRKHGNSHPTSTRDTDNDKQLTLI